MHLYQNEISIIKYFNYDDTSKTKDVRKYQICFQFLNYYALKIKWNYGCANAHQLIRHSGVIYPERRIILLYKYDKTTASQPVQISVWTPFSFSIVPKKHKFKKKTSTNFALLTDIHCVANNFMTRNFIKIRKHFPILKFSEQKVTSID